MGMEKDMGKIHTGAMEMVKGHGIQAHADAVLYCQEFVRLMEVDAWATYSDRMLCLCYSRYLWNSNVVVVRFQTMIGGCRARFDKRNMSSFPSIILLQR
jgi:hypothetical protein